LKKAKYILNTHILFSNGLHNISASDYNILSFCPGFCYRMNIEYEK